MAAIAIERRELTEPLLPLKNWIGDESSGVPADEFEVKIRGLQESPKTVSMRAFRASTQKSLDKPATDPLAQVFELIY